MIRLDFVPELFKKRFSVPLSILGILVPLAFFAGCSSSKKHTSGSQPPELRALLGKKVALISVDGEATAKKMVEVALVNQLVQKGTFILVSKQDVDAARLAPDQDPTDWKGTAEKAGADYALHAKVIDFEAPIHEGYSTREVVDSQLAEEQGTNGKTQQVFKVKAMEGHVRVQLTFTRLNDNDVRTAFADAEDRVEASAHETSIHLPPQLRFLEQLANKAFEKFFTQFE